MNKKMIIKPISFMVACAVLAGCAATKQANDRFEKDNGDISKAFESSRSKSSQAGIFRDDGNKTANFSRTDRNWVNPTPIPRTPEKPALPDFFFKNVSLTMPGSVSAIEIISEMQRASGINFSIAQDVYDTAGGQGRIITSGASSTSQRKGDAPLLISDFVFRGTLETALNIMAAKANVSWKWNGREIEIYRFETRTYNISALAGSTDTSSNVSLKGDTAGSSASSSGGGSASAPTAGEQSSNVTRKATLSTWEEIKSFIISQLSPNGTMAVLESSGAVTIKDIPSVHARLDKSIADLNALLSKQIYLNVDVFVVSTKSSDNFGVDWNLVWSSSRANVGYNSTMGGSASGPNSFSVGVLKGPFSGTSVTMTALSALGNTSLVNQFSVSTLNGQPAPIAVNKKYAYLKETTVTASPNGGEPVQALKPGEIASGINMNIIPKIEPNGNILLEYSMNLSDVEDIRKFTASDGSSIELPTSLIRSVSQRSSLRSGNTLVLSGFKQLASKMDQSGVGSPKNIIAGGLHHAEVGDQYLVITVTPYIANSNAYAKGN